MTGRVRRSCAVMAVVAVGAAMATGCGGESTTSSSDTTMSAAEGGSSDTTAEMAPPTSGAESSRAESLRATRYCEILAVSPSADGLEVQVYSTFPLNDCPDAEWRALDLAAAASDTGAAIALANGPRYWTIDAVSRTTSDDVERREFGGLAMNRYATVALPGPEAVTQRYVTRQVDRKAIMTFFAGNEVYVLIDPDGAEHVMQSWSQQVDPSLGEEDLADLAERLALPEGWQFEARVLDADLVIEFGERPAQVLQDDLSNTYSLVES